MSPKEIINQTYKRVGEVLNMSSTGEVGRDLHQVYNMKSSQSCASDLTTNCDRDLVYDLLEQHYNSAKEFIRSVSFDKGVTSVVCTNQQLDDLKRFCAYNDSGIRSVLGIDPKFNLGDFYVTPYVYEHKLVINKVTGRHPYFIGPVLIH